MKLTITAAEDDMADYVGHVLLGMDVGNTSGQVNENTYWDSGDDFADAPTPEQVVDKVIADGYVDSGTFEFAAEVQSFTAFQVRNLMILAAKEARK